MLKAMYCAGAKQMNRHKALLSVSSAFIGLYCTTITPTVWAQPAEKDVSKFISGPGTAIYGISGVVLPLVCSIITGATAAAHTNYRLTISVSRSKRQG